MDLNTTLGEVRSTDLMQDGAGYALTGPEARPAFPSPRLRSRARHDKDGHEAPVPRQDVALARGRVPIPEVGERPARLG